MKKVLALAILFLVLVGFTTQTQAQYYMNTYHVTVMNNATNETVSQENNMGITLGTNFSYMKFTTGKYWTLTQMTQLSKDKYGFVGYSDGVKCVVIFEQTSYKYWLVTVVYSDYTIQYKAKEQ